MPRYYFDIVGNDADKDDDGTVLADSEAAKLAAIRIVLDVAANEIPGDLDLVPEVSLRDEAGTTIYTVRVALHAETPN